MGEGFFAHGGGVVGEQGEVVEELGAVRGRRVVDGLSVEDERFGAEGGVGEVVGFARGERIVEVDLSPRLLCWRKDEEERCGSPDSGS